MTLIPLTTRQLVKIATIGGILVGGSCLFLRSRIQKNLHRADYYQLAINQVNSHKALVKNLGEPIYFGDILSRDMDQRKDKDDPFNFEISFRAPNHKGTLHFSVLEKTTRTSPEELTEDQDKKGKNINYELISLHVELSGRPYERIVVPIRDLNKLANVNN